MIQASFFDWLANNLIVSMFIMIVLIIVLMAIYVKMFVRFIPEGTPYKFYRKGVLIREGTGGTMVVRIPFFDRLEIAGGEGAELLDRRLDPFNRSIRKQVVVDASVEEVWDAWTTTEGVKTFFAPDAKVDLRQWGPYEMYFDPDALPGSRGGEGLKILSYLPREMLSFEWNAPPSIPRLRRVKTWVVVQFRPVTHHTTEVTLTHCGWGEGPDWEKAYTYFERAWQIVMDRCQRRFSEGAIRWDEL